MVRLIITHSNIPISYQGDALLTPAYIFNLVPSKSVSSTHMSYRPLGNLTYFICDLGGLQLMFITPLTIFGKLGARSKKRIFIRYSEHSKRYVFMGEHESGFLTELESQDVDNSMK